MSSVAFADPEPAAIARKAGQGWESARSGDHGCGLADMHSPPAKDTVNIKARSNRPGPPAPYTGVRGNAPRTPLGRESLVRGECQARVVPGDDPVLEQALQLLDQVRPHEVCPPCGSGRPRAAARQVGIRLDLLRDHRNMTDREPSERVIEADAPPVRKVERVGHHAVLAPLRGQGLSRARPSGPTRRPSPRRAARPRGQRSRRGAARGPAPCRAHPSAALPCAART